LMILSWPLATRAQPRPGVQRRYTCTAARIKNAGAEYSKKVPREVQIWKDADARSGRVTCGDGR
jgi:hypothetical protein